MFEKIIIVVMGVMFFIPLSQARADVTRSSAMERIHQQSEARQKALRRKPVEQLLVEPQVKPEAGQEQPEEKKEEKVTPRSPKVIVIEDEEYQE